MKKILVAAGLLVVILTLATCERTDMYNTAMIGLAPQSAIYLYAIGPMSGDLQGRKSVDETCYNQGVLYSSVIGAGTVKAFISMSMFDDLRLLVPGEYWSYPVIGISSSLDTSVIARTWAEMIMGSITTGINVAVGISGSTPNVWWSGSNTDGSYNATDNCNSWSTSESAYTGEVGADIFNSATAYCSDSAYLLCIAY